MSQKLEQKPEQFVAQLKKVAKAKPIHSKAVISLKQRHYRSQRSVPTIDASTTILIDTILGSNGSKQNSIWLDLIRDASRSKSKYNYQLEFGYQIAYECDQSLQTTKAIDQILKAFRGLTQIYSYLTANFKFLSGRASCT